MPRPFVTLHFAQSLDGRIGFGPGRERALLSSEEGMLAAHRARAEHDAVLVGIETALHDDPLLTARAGGSRQPLRVVLDSALRLPLTARLLDHGSDGAVVVFGTSERASPQRRAALEARGARAYLTGSDGAGRVALDEMLDTLVAQGVRSLLVEGGAQVLTSFLLARAADRAEIEVAPCWLGEPATPSLRDLGIIRLAQSVRLERLEVERLGPSVLLRGDVAYPSSDGA